MSYDRLAPTISSKAKKLFGSGNMGWNNWRGGARPPVPLSDGLDTRPCKILDPRLGRAKKNYHSCACDVAWLSSTPRLASPVDSPLSPAITPSSLSSRILLTIDSLPSRYDMDTSQCKNSCLGAPAVSEINWNEMLFERALKSRHNCTEPKTKKVGKKKD